MCKKKKPSPTITTHMNPVREAWTQGIECLPVALVLTQFSLRMKTVTHDWTHTMILTDRACDLISVSSSHLSVSAVFICSVPSWELAASAQQLQRGTELNKDRLSENVDAKKEKKEKKLRLSAWKWHLQSKHLKKKKLLAHVKWPNKDFKFDSDPQKGCEQVVIVVPYSLGYA